MGTRRSRRRHLPEFRAMVPCASPPIFLFAPPELRYVMRSGSGSSTLASRTRASFMPLLLQVLCHSTYAWLTGNTLIIASVPRTDEDGALGSAWPLGKK